MCDIERTLSQTPWRLRSFAYKATLVSLKYVVVSQTEVIGGVELETYQNANQLLINEGQSELDKIFQNSHTLGDVQMHFTDISRIVIRSEEIVSITKTAIPDSYVLKFPINIATMFKGESCPFVIQVDDSRGRYLAATRDIKQGEIVFQDRPLVVGPCGIGIEKSKSFSTCLGCYKNVTSLYKCSKCGWPVCNAQCEMMPDHATFECVVFADCPVSPITNPLEYEKIKILRCLMLKEKHPEKWKLLMNLESHTEIRKQSFYAVSNNISYYKFIRQECHLTQYTFDEIHHMAGVSAVNSFGTSGLLGQHSYDGNSRFASFLFYYASLVSHDCLPNSRSVVQQKGKSYIINIIASTNIRIGEPISSSYVESNFGTSQRRENLLEHFYFSCKCRRCQDPSELGSFLTAVKCNNPICKSGFLIPKNPLEPQSDWVCNQNSCDAISSPVWIGTVLLEIRTKIRNSQSLEGYGEVLETYKGKILHKNHYLIFNLECDMIRLINRILQKVDTNEILRFAKWQIELCRHCLSVADLIQPGSNRLRGNLLYFLQEALLTICTCKISQCRENKDLDMIRKRCKKQFAEALEIMKESKIILMTEPVGSEDWQRGTTLSLETARVKSLMSYLSFKD